jgi:hypothetical protein
MQSRDGWQIGTLSRDGFTARKPNPDHERAPIHSSGKTNNKKKMRSLEPITSGLSSAYGPLVGDSPKVARAFQCPRR